MQTVNKFEPIAIIGQGCVLPGCFSPDDLWQTVVHNQVNLQPAPADAWRVNLADVVAAPGETTLLNKAWHSLGGYVTGFDQRFDAGAFALDPALVAGLDPVFQWTLYAAQAALRDAGYAKAPGRAGLIMGNLSYPSPGLSQYFEEHHLGALFPDWQNPARPREAANRFMSGLPAMLTAKALGLSGEAFALDAACASSLYALKLGCDHLHNGKADLMLIGGVCAADQLFLHVGFTALNALSPSGQSRPFNQGADGLIPAEGAGFVVIKRLADAVRDQDTILGVVRGIGLSNDGREGGFLSPAQSGQVQSMQRALAGAGLPAAAVSYVECHATGTSGGDATEINSLQEVYATATHMHLSSLKGNIGHSITASGVGSIIKVLGAFRHQVLPPSPNAYPLNENLADTIFSVTDQPQTWKSATNRVAGISNFGFGGNNAHVILEEWSPATAYAPAATPALPARVAVVGVEVQTSQLANAKAYLSHLLGNATPPAADSSQAATVAFNVRKLSSPPNDLKYALGQQLLMLHTSQQLLAQGLALDPATTGVFIGMGVDAEINRYGFRKRVGELLAQGGITSSATELAELEAAIGPILNAAAVLGTMPNIPANRLNNQFDFRGMGFTLSAEELSGAKALDVAITAIQKGELTAALVGAVDLSNEPVHQAALASVLDISLPTTDAAVVLALKSYDQAVQDGDPILATIAAANAPADAYQLDSAWVRSKAGYSHASSALLEIATAVLLCCHRLQLSSDKATLRPLLEGSQGFAYAVGCTSLFGGENHFVLQSALVETVALRSIGTITIHSYAADSKAELLVALQADAQAEVGTHRLGIVCSAESLAQHRTQALALLQREGAAAGWLTEHIHYRNAPMPGELAFVFTGAASAYPQMGKELLYEFPGLIGSLQPCCTNPAFAGDWIYEADSAQAKLPFYQLTGSSLLCQLHASFTQQVLGLRPAAAIGLSSGETNSVFALGVWQDMDALLQEIDASDLYRKALGVDFTAIKEHWGLVETDAVNWENWRILAPVDEVERLLSTEERAYLTIVNTRNDCVIGGDQAACQRILEAIGASRAMPLQHDIAVHCDAVTPFAKTWRELHTRRVTPVPDIRFYSNFLDGVYQPSSSTVADALTGQALQPIDFPKIIEQAWADGVRIFVEHGPRNSLSTAIREILRGKEFACVALDRFGKSSQVEVLRASTELWALGVPLRLDALRAPQSLSGASPVLEISFPLHMNEIALRVPAAAPMPDRAVGVVPAIASANHAPAHRVLEKAPELAVTRRARSERAAENRPAAAPAVPAAPATSAADPVVPILAPHALAEQPVAAVPGLPAALALGDDEVNPAIELLRNQHQLVLQAHEQYLQLQLQGQRNFAGLIDQMVNHLFQAGAAVSEYQAEHAEPWQLAEPAAPAAPAQPEPEAVTKPIAIEPVVLAPAMPPAPAAPARMPISSDLKQEKPLPGPKFSRAELEVLASGNISTVFGPLFEQQDQYAIQVRMPEPPLLLCDRVTGLLGEPGTLGLGTIWTETDVTPQSWYLHNNRMPPGIFIEAGQADLLLISYLGIDFQNRGERAYRLLGCELTFFGELPKVGETLKYEIHVDGYAQSGETTLFFFHYDCHIDGKLRISVRQGQAGFFSTQELAESKGVIWDAGTAAYGTHALPEFPMATRKTSFSMAEVEAYTRGEMVACFGPELGWTQTHTRSPRSQGGDHNFIKSVTAFDLAGGPAHRGYLRAETLVSPDDWYFKGHFKNDPCMPGTLMADACLQMMAFYMVGAGLSTTRDGWRFEPVTDTKYKFVCRGQVTPAATKVTYEIFVDEVILGEYPTLYAHVLTTVDGTKAFLCERLGLRLVPDWPLATMPELLGTKVVGKPIAAHNGFSYGQESLINCALGRPGDAFGPDFDHYNNGLRSPRLPGPPYHFMTRIAENAVVPGQAKHNPYVVAEYDVPANAWYFVENGRPTMPYAVLMEVALQPCGWLSTFVCQHDLKGKELLFRNLDGKAVQHRAVVPTDQTIVTKTTLTSLSNMGDIIIVKFEVESSVAGEPVFTMQTVFGFFDPESMRSQKGLAITAQEQENLALAHNCAVDLTSFPAPYFTDSTARLPASKLLMVDRVVVLHEAAGKYGQGYIQGEKDVEMNEWFFKAHFFQDPVQPGSLGIEAMLQLVQFYMLEQGWHRAMAAPQFEPIALRDETEWHYRGQVTPDKQLITIDFDVKQVQRESGTVTVVGEARLWVDGLKIYHAPCIGMRLTDAGQTAAQP